MEAIRQMSMREFLDDGDGNLASLGPTGDTILIEEGGKVRAAIQDVAAWDRDQEALALLRLLAIGKQEIAEGKTRPARDVFNALKIKLAGMTTDRT